MDDLSTGVTPEMLAQDKIKAAFADVVGPASTAAAVTSDAPEPSKQAAKDAFQATTLTADASVQEAVTFERLRSEFGGVLHRGGDNGQELIDKMAEIRAYLAVVASAVSARKLAMAALASEFSALDLAGIAAATDPEKAPVEALRKTIAALFLPADAHREADTLRQRLVDIQGQIDLLKNRIAIRLRLKLAIEKQLAELGWASIDGALDDEEAPLLQVRATAEQTLTALPLDDAAIDAAGDAANDLVPQLRDLALVVEQRHLRKKQIADEAADIEPPTDAPPTCLDSERTALVRLLATTPLSDKALDDADTALNDLRKRADQVAQETQRLIIRRAALRLQLTTAWDVVTATGLDKDGAVKNAHETAAALLADGPVTAERLDAFPAALSDMRRLAKNAAVKDSRGSYVGAERKAIEGEMAALRTWLTPKEITDLELGASEIKASMLKTLTKAKINTNLKAVQDLRTLLEKCRNRIGSAIEEMAGQRAFLRAEAAKPDPADVDISFATPLRAHSLAIEQELVDPLTQAKLDKATQVLKAREALYRRAEQDVVDGKAVTALLVEVAEAYKTAQPAARSPVQAELAGAWAQAQLLAAKSGADRDMKAARTALENLRSRLADVAVENGKAAATKAKLQTAKAAGSALSEADAAAIHDAFGPDAIESLTTGLGSLDKLAELSQHFKAGKPGGIVALGALMRNGLGSGKALAALYQGGCDGDPARLLQFEASFAAPQDQAQLRGMLDTAMGGNAALLNRTLKTGCGLDAEPVTARKDFATAAADLNTFCATFKDDKDQKKLAGLLQKGGLADQPAVFGHLLKTGCEGDPAAGEDSMAHRAEQMRRLAAAFNTPADQERLKGLLDKGGLGNANSPKVLAHVLKTGCDGDPAKLKQLGAAFKSDQDLAKLESLLKQGGLGGGAAERQDTLGKVLGQSLRREAKPTEGQPDRLKELHTAFSGNGGADLAQLKTMMDTFNADLRPIFTTPPPQVAARKEPVPGERLATLLNSKNMNGNIAKLKGMYDGLKAQTNHIGDTVGTAPPTPVPKASLSLPNLLRNAATIKKADYSGAAPTKIGTGACAAIKSADMSHFCDRHTRQHTQFNELAGKTLVTNELQSANEETRKRGKRKAKKSTLWPEGITDKQIAAYVDLALAALGAGAPTEASYSGGALPAGARLSGNFIQVNGLAIASTPGFTVTIGFERMGVNNIAITQFYPEGGPGLEEIVFYDMHAIQTGIH